MGLMKRWVFFISILFLFACKPAKVDTWFSAVKAESYFKTVKELCDADNGKLWGENLYGPIMYIDTKNRFIYANSQDKEGLLRLREGVYSGIVPKEKWIANTAIDFGGTLYAVVPLPDEEKPSEIVNRTIHSLFHCFQERSGLAPSSYNTRHLNDKNARLYLKLEWKALMSAIKSDGDMRNQAIRDALIFRGARRELFPGAVADENKFEDYEGLTTFTYLKLGTAGNEELSKEILSYLDRIYNNFSYAHAYGFIHGALYAYLMQIKGFDFKSIRNPDFDLGMATSELYGINLPEHCRDVAGSLAMNYDISLIMAEESKHNEMINANVEKIINEFIKKPVVFLQMESPNFSFEPEDINSLDSLGTLYKKLRVSDNWGKLVVNEGGALLTNDLKTLRISAKDLDLERNRISGSGWSLMLNEGWQAVEDGDNFTIRKQQVH